MSYCIRPSLWFVTGQNAVCYDEVYDLLLVRTLWVTTKFMICFWSEHYVMTKFMICYFSERHMLRKVIVTYKLTAVFILYSTKFMICYWSEHYGMTRFMICFWSEHCMLCPSLWFVTFQNAICYDK